MAGSRADSATTSGLVIASIVLSVIAVVGLFFLAIGPSTLAGSLAVVLGAEGRKRAPHNDRQALFGISLGALAIVVGLVETFWLLYVVV